MSGIIGLIINLISGAVGGNIAGGVLKEQSLGTVGNPIAGLVQSYQNIFFFGREPHWIHLGTVAVCAAVALIGGWWVFDRLRDSLVEEI